MIKVVIKYLGFILLAVNFSAAQDELQSLNAVEKNKTSIIKLDNADSKQPDKISEKKILDNPELILNRLRTPPPPQQYTFEFPKTLISSFNNNFHFAGFWDKYAVINVTPQMYIKPFEFISIYANHSTSLYIPISGIKEHIKSLAIEGAAILAVDNAVKLLFSSDLLLQSVINFIAKNLTISYIKKTFADKNIPEFKYYYYAINIRF